jgi:peptidoglycan/xylan/chitin deacetylase (PgdA/CDA1 family)
MINKSIKVAVFMYHYVRPIRGSRFSNIKGLEFTDFQNQLDYLLAKTTIISPSEFKNLSLETEALEKPYSVLTFDDGLVDHYEYVFPELMKRKLSAFFFPLSLPLQTHKIASVHQLQFILEAVSDADNLIEEIEELIEDRGTLTNYDLTNIPTNVARYDQPKEKKIKFILQRGLQKELREEILGELFRRHVSVDEVDFFRNVYMNLENITEMSESGMDFGSHGARHDWLEQMSIEEQKNDIGEGLKFISQKITASDSEKNTFAYPYGSYNQETLNILGNFGFSHAFTTRTGFFDLESTPLFEIPRFDTNELYKVL